MTNVVLKKENGFWIRLEIYGHADYANFGEDIVCAAISTSVIMSINLLERVIPNHFVVSQDDKKGYICLKIFCFIDIMEEKLIFINQFLKNLKIEFLKYKRNIQKT